MLVLHEAKVIFLKARKTAGTSLELALCRFASPQDVVTRQTDEDELLRARLGFRGPQHHQFSNSELSRRQLLDMVLDRKRPEKFTSHVSAKILRNQLDDNVWQNYEKVAVIRNPFDMMVSSYFWDIKSHTGRSRLSFENYVLARPELIRWNDRIYRIHGEDVIDRYLRYEHLDEDLGTWEERMPALRGLRETFSGIQAKGRHRPEGASTETMFSQAPRAHALIRLLCADQIEHFGWQVPAHS